MGIRYETDVKKLVSSWRDAMGTRSAFDADTIDELESHLWEEIDRRIAEGHSPREAVLAAAARIGHADVLAGEFRKVTEWSQERRPSWQTPYWTIVMWKNYLTIAVRNMRKQPIFSLINIGGLGIGLACTFLILLFVRHEWSYDDFHEAKDQLYRLEWHRVKGEYAGARYANMPTGLVRALEGQYPEIEELVIYDTRGPYLEKDGESRSIGRVAFMSSQAFEVFTYPLLRGDPSTVLQDPYSIVLTETAGQSLFGSGDPVGETLRYGDKFDMTVTGVMKDVPTNSVNQFVAVAPIQLMNELMGEGAMNDFDNWNYNIFAKLTPGADPEVLSEKFFPVLVELANGNEEQASRNRLELHPITGLHTRPDVSSAKSATIEPRRLQIFLGIAALILLIAGVNFTNLATARATQRAREVGVRKTSGANRQQLATQFLGESVLMSGFAVVAAIGIAIAALPQFQNVINSPVTFSLSDLSSVGMLVGIGLLVGVIAGGYPAVYLSSFSPAAVLKGDIVKGKRGALLQKGLIVLQFGISIFLMVSTLSVYRQLQHMETKALGFDKEQVVFAPLVAPVRENFDAFRSNVLQHSRILNISRAGNVPGRVNTSRGYYWMGKGEEEENNQSFNTVLADYGYLETLGLDLIAGRDFREDVASDYEDAYILNESALARIGFESPEEAIGAPFRAWDKESGQIIGVVEDFHYRSLRQDITPVVINIKPWIGYVLFRLAPGSAEEAVDLLRAEWKKFASGYPMDYRFLDEDFDRLYRTERNLGNLFTFFSIIAVFIACLGLFGLATYSAQRRRKEIGVRKVLGADARSIVILMSKEFTQLVVIGFVIAAPLGWYAMDRWLDNFAYHTNISLWVFAASGLTSLFIAWLTVSYQSISAALADPVQSMRYE